MTKLYVQDYVKFEFQNRSNKKEECSIEWICSGVLLDNVLMYCKRGIALIAEHPINTNSSNYMVTFAPYSNENEIKKIWDMFESMVEYDD